MADIKEANVVEEIVDQSQTEEINKEEENQEPVAFNIHVVSPKQDKIPLQVSVAYNPVGSTTR